MTARERDKEEFCNVHVDQVATLASLKTRLNMLIGLTATFGSLSVGILMTINTTTNHLAVNVATLNNEMKTMSGRVISIEERLAWCEREIRELKMHLATRKASH